VNQYRVIPYDGTLLAEIVRLWEESHTGLDLDRRLTVFRWFTQGNPFLGGRPPYWCLHDGSRIVGMHGHMPVVFGVNGAERLGYMAHDDLLRPNCRGQGLGQVLLEGVRAFAAEFAAVMWLNESNHRSYRKAGWVDVPGFRLYVRFLDAGSFARKLSKAALGSLVRIGGPLALSLVDWRVRVTGRRDLRLAAVKRFDTRVDALWDRAKSRAGISVCRTSDYLNWRYISIPTQCHERLAAVTEGGDVAGYVVWRVVPVDGDVIVRVLDVLWDPGERHALATLLLAVVDATRELGASRMLCAAAHPTLVRGLRWLGFLPSPREEFYMISNWGELAELADVTNIRAWHLTLGDADGDIWNAM
jgi:GNAT superfamily N-acetyltransferase